MKKGQQTFHHDKHAAVIESVFFLFLLSVEAKGTIVKRLDVIYLQ